MKEYIIVKLENDRKVIIIDSLNLYGKEYFLITEILEDENLSPKYEVCMYDYQRNCFIQLDDLEKRDFIMSQFEKNIQNQSIFDSLIDEEEFVKLKIIKIDNYNYTFELENGSKIIRNIEFYLDNKPKINSCIYISKKVINEEISLQYGYVKDLNNINNNEIIKVVDSNIEYYYQRYYG